MRYGKPTDFRWDPPEHVCRTSPHPAPAPSKHAETLLYRLIWTPLAYGIFFGVLLFHSLLLVTLQLIAWPLGVFARWLQDVRKNGGGAMNAWRRVYLCFLQFTQRAWVDGFEMVFYLLSPTHLVVTGDELEGYVGSGGSIESAIVISNHTTHFDWLYLWFLAKRQHAHGMVKIILKQSVKHIPVFGWVGQWSWMASTLYPNIEHHGDHVPTQGASFFEFIFLSRSWANDKTLLACSLDRIAREQQKLWLILYPEGTLISDQTVEVDRAYARKAGIAEIDRPGYMLLPRSTGFELCLRHLAPDLDAIYDVTMAFEGADPQYPQNLVSLENLFVHGRQPRRVHMHVRRIPIDRPLATIDHNRPLASAPSMSDLTATIAKNQQQLQTLVDTTVVPSTSSARSNVSKISEALALSPTPTTPLYPATPFAKWLHDEFMVKDRLLDHFYRKGHFPLGQRRAPLIIAVGDRSAGLIRGVLTRDLMWLYAIWMVIAVAVYSFTGWNWNDKL